MISVAKRSETEFFCLIRTGSRGLEAMLLLPGLSSMNNMHRYCAPVPVAQRAPSSFARLLSTQSAWSTCRRGLCRK